VTKLGEKVSKSLKALANKFLLSAVLGTTSKDYTLNQLRMQTHPSYLPDMCFHRKKFEEEGNLVKLWIEEVSCAGC
jgi:hypothetical protein